MLRHIFEMMPERPLFYAALTLTLRRADFTRFIYGMMLPPATLASAALVMPLFRADASRFCRWHSRAAIGI